MRRVLGGALAAAALAAGCGGGGTPSPAPPPPPETVEALGSGYFVGTGPDGLGATVDLRASDPVVEALEAALRVGAPAAGPAPSVGIASLVNGSSTRVRTPAFTAVLDTGGRATLRGAVDALRGRSGPADRRAAALVPPRRVTLAPRASAVEYVVLYGAVPGRVAEVLMRGVEGGPVRLAPRPR